MKGFITAIQRLLPRSKRAWAVVLLILLLIIIVTAMIIWRMQQGAPSTPKPAQSSAGTASVQVAVEHADATALTGEATFAVTTEGFEDIEKVEYYIDDTFIGVSYAPPFSLRFDTATLANGTYTLKARAYAKDGTTAESELLTITIANQSETPSTGTAPTQDATGAGISNILSTLRTAVQLYNSQTSSADQTAPTTPGNLLLSANDGYTVGLQWSASTDDRGISQYIVFRDGEQLGTSTTTSFTDQTVVPGNSYTYRVIAKDAANNVSAGSNEPAIVLAPSTIWHSAESPASGNFDNAPDPIELGVKFRPLVNGKVTGMRFYKASGSAGTHVGHLWASDGTPLATASFSSETASGWQQVSFSQPVAVNAGTTYVVSYFAPSGGYGYSSAYFATAGLTSQYLSALRSGVDGNNGLYRVGSSGFPTNSFDNTNYWVEPTFAPNKGTAGPTAKVVDNSQLFPGYPGSNNTGVPAGKRLPKRDRTIFIYNNNAVLDNIELTADISVQANNVTIRNVRIAPQQSLIWGITQITGKSGLTVEDTEIYGDGTNQLQYGIIDNGTTFTGRRINIHTMTQAIQSNVNVLIEDSYFHGQIYFAGDHSGGYLNTGGNNVVLRHNNMRNPLNQTTTLGLFCDFAPVTNVTATDNLLAGGGYAVYAPPCAGSGGIKFFNNKFDRAIWPNGGLFGPVTLYNPAQPGNEWVNNSWLEDGTPVIP